MEQIGKKITGYQVKTTAAEPLPTVQQMHEDLKRPDVLLGSTYKVKTPQSDHALYITINDMVLNQGTAQEELHPYEIFLNSKNMENFQWVLALTRGISAVFRKGGDVCFLVEELRAIFDPKGGYFKKGGVFMPSLVAEIGLVIETHLKSIGRLKPEPMDTARMQFIGTKLNQTGFLPAAILCNKCMAKAVTVMDGCQTCLNCGDSKCG
ncbi:TSCPD domain-containing protein [Methylovulum miyakonense]|uniref:TSCPD domain-containing protein n=1 Tax=Methylovulum miyakonense TaxID=645578 RepID=UPI00036E4BDB|nr:hypothetical protein [Methylovulum miyakonense]